MLKLLKKKANNKGVAIELAIVTLLVIFALCSVLLTIAELSIYTNKRISTKVSERADLSQVAEDLILTFKGFSGDDDENLVSSSAFLGKYEGEYIFDKDESDDVNLTWIVKKASTDKSVMKLVFNTSGELIEYHGSGAPGLSDSAESGEGY